MIIEQPLEQVEQHNQQMQKQRIQRTNKRLTVALTTTVVAMAEVVMMAATELKDSHFDTVTARKVLVTNGAGENVVELRATPDDAGEVRAAGEFIADEPNGKEGKGRTLKPGP